MTIAFVISDQSFMTPGVYDNFRVANSLPTPAPAGRSVFVLGEAEEGIPGALLDQRLNFFTDFPSVKDFYKSGPIVDAARMLFSKQPAFNGSVLRFYPYKTNNSTAAERDLTGPANYGSINAVRFGEAGNLINSQVVDSQSETLPTVTFNYLPSPVSRSLRVMASGVLHGAITVSAGQVASDVVTTLDALANIGATGGTARTDLTNTINVSIAASNDLLTLTKTGGSGTWDVSIQVSDIVYIAPGTDFAGGADENAGVYSVESVTTTVLALRQLKHVTTGGEANAVAFDTSAITAAAVGQLKINGPMTVSFNGTSARGTGSSIEILENASASKLVNGLILRPADFSNMVGAATAAIASVTVSVPSADKVKVDLSTGAWNSTPKAGDMIHIGRNSLLAGASKLNVGYMVVESAGAQTLTASHLFSGMTTEAVATVALASVEDAITSAAGFLSTSLAARKITSATERKVKMIAVRESDGVQFPDNSVGGRVVLEVGYYHSTATAATVSIDANRIMTISPTGGSLVDVIVNVRKYSSLSELVTFLNTRPNVYARVPNPQYASFSTDVLDMVSSVPCLDGQAVPAYNSRLKRDYSDWTQLFVDNSSLIAFSAGTLNLKAGLPDAETAASFLDGATLGGTSQASIQAGLDAALRIDVRNVVPLFSRDASKDILDGLTEPSSSYSIDAIHAAVKAHVSTASSSDYKRERFGVLSHYGSFANSQLKASTVSYERCQMTFQLHNATDGDGNLVRFLPWISACAIAAGRSQAVLGTAMLRKPFLLSSAEHLGDVSLFSDSLIPEFDPEDRPMLAQAIIAGLLVFNAVQGFGVRVESPDLTTRSRENDPQAWVYERASVYFVTDEVRQTVRSVLENFIGNRVTDAPLAVVKQAITDAIGTFLPGTGNGALISGSVLDLKKVGNVYLAKLRIFPVEALEAIGVDVEAARDV